MKSFRVVSDWDSPPANTKGKIYTIMSEKAGGLDVNYFIGDDGNGYSYYKENFTPLSEYRSNKIEALMK